MLPWQEEYLSNAAELVRLRDARACIRGPETGASDLARAESRAGELIRRNNALLRTHLFPALDHLHAAGEEEIRQLTEFAARAVDWKDNLDTGIAVTIHEALLSLYRVRKDRNSMIRELYQLGMSLYYQRRMLEGLPAKDGKPILFENEMVFTEAASYFRYFEEIEDEETRGYLIRSLANVAICIRDSRRKIGVTRRTLEILRDEHYRALAPGLPWERFLRSSHQQMSANRESLSRGDLNQEELSAVLDSCYEVFRPEEQAKNPGVRWLWPYYEMEYSCGYVTAETTIRRLKRLIRETPTDAFDMHGVYGNVYLTLVYGKLLEKHPDQRRKPENLRFLDETCREMQKYLLSCPAGFFEDFFQSHLLQTFHEYPEEEGVMSYREFTRPLMARFFWPDYCFGRRRGEIMAALTRRIFRKNPGFFDEIPLDAGAVGKEESLLAYARDAGLYADLGRMMMNLTRRSRDLFEREARIARLHPLTGWECLRKQASTRLLADVALGHHGWYNGSDRGYPDAYVRTDSPCRAMTDIAALAGYMMTRWRGDMPALLREVFALEGKRFSPLVTEVLGDGETTEELRRLLAEDDTRYLSEAETLLRPYMTPAEAAKEKEN